MARILRCQYASVIRVVKLTLDTVGPGSYEAELEWSQTFPQWKGGIVNVTMNASYAILWKRSHKYYVIVDWRERWLSIVHFKVRDSAMRPVRPLAF